MKAEWLYLLKNWVNSKIKAYHEAIANAQQIYEENDKGGKARAIFEGVAAVKSKLSELNRARVLIKIWNHYNLLVLAITQISKHSRLIM